jgi:hypothetical protein
LAITALNGAAFEALQTQVGPIFAGLLIGAVDLLVATPLMHSALKEPPETAKEKLAQSVRDITYSSLGEDLDGLRTELRDFVSYIRRLRQTVGDVTKGVSRSRVSIQTQGRAKFAPTTLRPNGRSGEVDAVFRHGRLGRRGGPS